jgi:hypothetical protein
LKKLSLIIFALLIIARDLTAERPPSVTIGWDPNPERNVAGYIFYERFGHRYFALDVIERSPEPSYTVPAITPGKHYYSVTAYTNNGIESDHSDELVLIRDGSSH